MIEFVVDLETMGNGPTAAIIAIGVVPVDTDLLTVLSDEFYEPVSLESSIKAGLKAESSTILWWMQQSEEARKEIFGRRADHLYAVLSRLQYWMSQYVPGKSERIVWGNGAVFDNVILASAYKAVGMDPPWTYKGDRCYRTLRAVVPFVEGPKRDGVAHKAVDDARWEAEHLIKLLGTIRP